MFPTKPSTLHNEATRSMSCGPLSLPDWLRPAEPPQVAVLPQPPQVAVCDLSLHNQPRLPTVLLCRRSALLQSCKVLHAGSNNGVLLVGFVAVASVVMSYVLFTATRARAYSATLTSGSRYSNSSSGPSGGASQPVDDGSWLPTLLAANEAAQDAAAHQHHHTTHTTSSDSWSAAAHTSSSSWSSSDASSGSSSSDSSSSSD